MRGLRAKSSGSVAAETSAIEYSAPPYVRITVRGGTALRRIAKSIGTTTALLRKLNPALLIDYAPPDVAGYEIWVPRLQDASAAHPAAEY